MRLAAQTNKVGRELSVPRFPLRYLLVLACLLLPVSLNAEEWPQFRGVNSCGVSPHSRNLPIEFSSAQGVLWSAKLGEGIASPVISHGRVFATAMVGPERFAVFCFDAVSGVEKWHQEFETGPLPPVMSPNVPASSTPAADGERVYIYFSTLGLLALDARNGELQWKYPLPAPSYLMGWGAAQSLVVYEDLLILCLDDDRDPFLLAVDKRSGATSWRTSRREMLAGYATPVICRAGGRVDLVVAGSGKLKGYDPRTGEQRWVCNSLLRTIMTTPVVVGETIYLSVQSYGDTDRVLKYALLQWKDTNQDGRLDKSEVDEAFWEKFDAGDADRDGFLEGNEIDAAFQAPTNRVGGGNIIQAIKGGGQGDVTETHLLWNLNHPAPSNIASPLVVGDQLFVVKKGGITASFDRRTGATLWMKKRLRNLGNYYASPVAGDGKIYVLGENGFLVVLKQGPKLEVLAKNDMGESCVATPAIADGRLYVRTLTSLYCISNEAR